MLCCKHSCGVLKAMIDCTNFQREIGYLLNFMYCVGNFYVPLFHTIELIFVISDWPEHSSIYTIVYWCYLSHQGNLDWTPSIAVTSAQHYILQAHTHSLSLFVCLSIYIGLICKPVAPDHWSIRNYNCKIQITHIYKCLRTFDLISINF